MAVIIKHRPISFLKKAVIPAVLFCILLFCFFIIRAFFIASPYFRIKKINIEDVSGVVSFDKSTLLKSLIEKNIFSIDIGYVSNTLKEEFPELKSITVKRIMPDQINIEIIPRIPIALVKSFRYFPIDEQAVVLSPDSKISRDLPVITGISIWSRPKVGEALATARIKSALDILQNMEALNKRHEYGIREIDVSHIKNIVFYLGSGLEIRMGYGDFKAKLNKLLTVLNDPQVKVDNLEYIDLRFKDVVLGPK